MSSFSNVRVKNKRDTSTNWETNNPVLLDGELIIVDTNAGDTRFKIGNGTKTYTQLPFQDEALYNVLSGKADDAHTHTYESITGLEDVINNVADSKFYVVTFAKGEDGEYHADLTFAEIREKFEAGGNMVARIDGTDYIPLLSAAPAQIIFSGIYKAQSVSLTIDSSDVCTLITTQLTENRSLTSHTSNTSNPHKVTCEQIGAATTGDVTDLQAELDGKQDKLVFDEAPTSGSVNSVTSGAVADYVNLFMGDIDCGFFTDAATDSTTIDCGTF